MNRSSRSWVLLAAFLGTAYLMWKDLEQPRARAKSGDSTVAVLCSLSSAPLVAAEPSRDPFVERLESGSLSPAKAKAWHLDGVVEAGKRRYALLNGVRLCEGDNYEQYVVQQIELGRILLARDGDTIEVHQTTDTPAAARATRPAVTELALSAVMTSPSGRMAVLNGQTVREGQSVDGVLVERVQPEGITVVRGEQRIELHVNQGSATGHPEARRAL